MTSLSVSIPEEQMNQILGRAILDSLSEESKNQIIGAALEYLNKPTGDHWKNDRQTPLQRIFNQAVESLTRTLVEELVRESEHYQQVREQVKGYLDKFPAVATDYELQAKIGQTVVDYMSSRQY